jgi:PleD family two-component response regulator
VVQQNKISITASFGVTRYLNDESLGACLRRSDDALYAAKTEGRNCVVAVDPE